MTWQTIAFAKENAIHLVILKIHTMGSALKEILRSSVISATIYIHLKQTYARN